MSSPRAGLDAAIATALRASPLTTLAANGIHNTQPPDGTEPPYTIYSHESETFRQLFKKREWQVVYRVTSIAPGAWPKGAAALDAAVDDLLEAERLTVLGFVHWDTQRWQSGDLPARPEDGDPAYQIVSRYRFWLDEVLT
jgi:hypothetical protein